MTGLDPPRTRGRSRLGGAAAVLLALTGCAGLPVDGPVHQGLGESPTSSAAPFDFNPPGPQPKGSKEQVVGGFLSALQATPVSTQPAFEFLSAAAAEGWRPERGTIVYGAQRVRPVGTEVVVELERSFSLDRRGGWAGTQSQPTPGTGVRELRLRLVLEDGEWRIDNPPNAMVIPQSHFESRYREHSLYFFDPTGSVLVPEPVYLPWGVQVPTLLVQGLLAGPPDGNRSVERSFFPAGTRLGVSVPVREDGVAEVPLSPRVLELAPEQLRLALAQLAWTLGQVAEVDSFQVTVDGAEIDLPGGINLVDVSGWEEFSPAISSASSYLFGIRGDAVVQLAGESESQAASFAGVGLGDPRSLGGTMDGQRFAVVSQDGRRVAVLPRSTAEVATPTATYDGSDLLRPMWDLTDRLWLVDRTAAGAEVLVARHGRVRRLPAPGLDGREVLAASLSRDGTRLVVAVSGDGSEARLMVLRVIRQGGGSPVRLTAAQPLPTPEPLPGVRAVGWRDPTTVAVLSRPTSSTSKVVLVACDGSSRLATFDPAVDELFHRATALAASPGGPMALVVATSNGRLQTLDVQGRWESQTVEAGLRAPAFVG